MKIGLIAAMDQEARLLIEAIKDLTKINLGHLDFYQGLLGSSPVVLVQSGIGKVNAAIATSLLISHFHADFIINTGSAGGIGSNLSIGDLVISDQVAYHDVDNRVFDYAYGQLPQMPARYKVKPEFSKLTQDLGQKLGWHTRSGLMVTGDSFVASKDQVEQVKSHFPKALVTEMEGAAVAQTCYNFDVDYLIIRCLSDTADEEASLDFEEFIDQAGKASARLVIELAEALAKHEDTK
ncbi:5'-methylthioadenosine/S-adenosylhomocysteine nucleosidase [Alloiococcus otitis]|uniref:5'-methylthioadenosine/S-adenosylhomocysteine nucleosidase n=1 Tax=Alloiococcus otitis ATCC 51267 TaxID=883081 RepID=K9ECN4_9LACT|nr:5'-methylthioadenosine/adenosylhomocysteine nucleosidase [Alloiococcus otitis]EKU94398.1 MTA/SAH nucleosidase [Alloiococcus otitis ATCC 51267]SUU81272.1 5'-methylthioadenosine/S-adenosylhomocysteine nucleosidase [Alloiococcus otitis]